ncbi:benzyl alcohol O-benzoyltransferase [Zea mays]|jgi:benzyl alcohol O-benzoyltransferase|uniref:(Z)-3-hexen-1-ol acetyltransferase n=1 Tax=Zea mays TaxID=4577 RepID=K7TIH9_MAIZE|nr:benzyl alcohol O-benzoyltransferase [Zea mays]AQK42023.1 (Z)-3-hexen-1-ol acetyltransferase [Zea mays]|eukprot:XP_008662941.1 benzyl alcohol O-benzoyltransferase [Zea mays]
MSTLAFAVRRREAELVGPAAPTPRDTKRLSDLDDQAILRRHERLMFFYRGRSGSRATNADPAAAVRRALSEALVPYYPLAGRLREVEEGRKLAVDCTGEGVMFVEADADVRLAELEAATGGLRPPFPCVDQLLFDVEGSGGVLGCPLLLVQVTRLLCGGFVVALRLNHTMCDAHGVAQFVSAVAELARGLAAPAVAPVWSREVLEARSLPEPAGVLQPHRRDHDVVPVVPQPPPPPPGDGDMVVRTFTFGPRDVAAIKKRLPPRLRDTATSYEALTAAIWRARTAALELAPGEEVSLVVVANCRGVRGLGIPDGYYGNAVAYPVARATAGALGLGNAVELVREAKAAVTAEYVRSAVDLLARRRGCPPALATMANVFAVSDNRHAGFHRVDLGWGVPVFGGVVTTVFGASFLVPVSGSDGKEAVAVPIVLPRPAMDRFASEIEMTLTLTCHAAVGSAAPPPPRGRL